MTSILEEFAYGNVCPQAQPCRNKLKQDSGPIYKRLECIYTDETELDNAVSLQSQSASFRVGGSGQNKYHVRVVFA